MTLPAWQSTVQLKMLLLDLISPLRAVSQKQVDDLTPNQWQALLVMVGQHRLGPLLRWQLGRAHAQLRIPVEVTTKLDRWHQKSAMRSLALRRELLVVHKVLQQANIAHIALKGAYLASHAYPDPALRPMRDLDILVPKHSLLDAYQALLNAGLTRVDPNHRELAAAALVNKHLPPLFSASSQISVELHGHLFDPPFDSLMDAEPDQDPSLWSRSIKARLANQELAFESPTDLLLHLIVHAVYDHQFNNGPLTLSDLAFLMNTHAIDWDNFWQIAGEHGLTKGCQLALHLTQRYWQVDSIRWGPHADDRSNQENAMNAAAQLMLCDTGASSYVKLNADLAIGKTAVRSPRILLQRFFPSKAHIAAMHPVSQSDKTVYLGYVLEWVRLLKKGYSAFLYARRNRHLQHEVKQLITLKQWL